MKRIVSVLLAICLVLASCSVALAAKATITQQPETTTVKKGGTLTFTVKAKNANGEGITWHFQNPLIPGSDITGKQLSKSVPGLKVEKPNSLKITLKKVPESMHGWTAYCHIGPKNGGINTDTVMILIDGLEVPEMPVASAASASSVSSQSGSAGSSTLNTAGAGSDAEILSPLPTPTPVPEKVVITGNSKIELYQVDSAGTPVGKAEQELTFNPGEKADFYLKLPDTTEGTIAYFTIDGIRFTPDGEVKGLAVKGWPTSAHVRIKVNKPGSEEQETSNGPLVLPEETLAPADPSSLVSVTCENCRFTGYKSSFATSGQVPVGTTITVSASGGMISKGYFINGAKKATHKKEASFQLVVEGDTTIIMEKQK